MVLRRVSRLLLRPSLWVAVLSVIAYWDDPALHGGYVYDDAGCIKHNVVVNGKEPFSEIWFRDYWGTVLTEIRSHKSFRPVTTATFRLNWLYSEYSNTVDDIQQHTYGFHVVNVLLHGIVSGLVTEAAGFVLMPLTEPAHLIGPW